MKLTHLAIVLALSSGCASAADQSRMAVVEAHDIAGKVFKRLGLPNQDYCWQQCLNDERCVATRWGVIADATAGQCQLFEGEIRSIDKRDLTTSDGLRIIVVASKKVPRD